MKTTGGARVAGTQGPESGDRGWSRMRLEKRRCVRRGPSPPTAEMEGRGALSGLQLQEGMSKEGTSGTASRPRGS